MPTNERFFCVLYGVLLRAAFTKFWHLHEKRNFSENWEKIVRFLNETDHDFAYWSIDGYVRWVPNFVQKKMAINDVIVVSPKSCLKQNGKQKCHCCALRPGQNEGYGLLEMDYETIRFFIRIRKLSSKTFMISLLKHFHKKIPPDTLGRLSSYRPCSLSYQITQSNIQNRFDGFGRQNKSG